ncbi:MAG: lysophospholipid acyltransferase family protein [Candidatus Goldiibacteriota bacterium]|jgi:KDO2-lipid IV(A) lauroyltransferase
MMYWILKAAQALISSLPIGPLYKLSGFITKTVFMLWKEKKENVYANYAVVLEKKLGRKATIEEIKRTAEENFINYGMFNVEFLYIHKLVKMSALPPLHDMDKIDRALAPGKGLIVCTLHFSNWDVAGMIVSGYYKDSREVWAVADDLGGGYSKFIQDSRNRYGIKIILPNKNLKDAYTCLNKGGILNVLVDRPIPADDKSGVDIEFFGRKARVGTAAARFAIKSGASIIVGCAMRDKNSFYGAPGDIIEYRLSGDKECDIKTITQAIMKSAESIIMEHPEQWYMFRRMWK